MKKLNKTINEKKLGLMIVFSVFMLCSVYAVDYLYEDFSSGNFPPEGWTIDQHSPNWSVSESNNAGGIAPEIKMSWTPQFNGTTRFISPPIDLTGSQNVVVEFNQNVDHYGGFYTLFVETRSNEGEWNIVWQINPEETIPGETVTVPIENDDINSSDFQICWTFSGDSYNINYWYLDNLRVYSPSEHDVSVVDVFLDSQYEPGETITPRATVANEGLNTETFAITCEIYADETQIYSDTHEPITLESGENDLVTFASYTLENENALYEVVIYTNLDSDMNNANDTLRTWLNTYTTEREMVVLEMGMGTWSGYCPGAAMGAEDLLANDCDVAVVGYHNGDDYANTSGEDRISYYDINGFPTAVFDGVLKNTDGDHTESLYSVYLPLYEERKEIKSAFRMELYGENYFLNYTFEIIVEKLAEIQNHDLTLQVIVTESNIDESWQGMDHLNYVERTMLPDSDGTILDFSSNDSLNVQLESNFLSLWNSENCELIAFIQDETTKEILQAAKVAFPDLQPPPVVADNEFIQDTNKIFLENYPNPFKNSTTIRYQIPGGKVHNSSIKIYNLKGQLVKNFDNLTTSRGKIIWNGVDNFGKPLKSGIYFYSIGKDKKNIRKMILISKK